MSSGPSPDQKQQQRTEHERALRDHNRRIQSLGVPYAATPMDTLLEDAVSASIDYLQRLRGDPGAPPAPESIPRACTVMGCLLGMAAHARFTHGHSQQARALRALASAWSHHLASTVRALADRPDESSCACIALAARWTVSCCHVSGWAGPGAPHPLASRCTAAGWVCPMCEARRALGVGDRIYADPRHAWMNDEVGRVALGPDAIRACWAGVVRGVPWIATRCGLRVEAVHSGAPFRAPVAAQWAVHGMDPPLPPGYATVIVAGDG